MDSLEWDQQLVAVLDLPLSNAVPIIKRMENKLQKVRHPSFLDAFRRHRLSFLSQGKQLVSDRLVREARFLASVREYPARFHV